MLPSNILKHLDDATATVVGVAVCLPSYLSPSPITAYVGRKTLRGKEQVMEDPSLFQGIMSIVCIVPDLG